MDLPPPVTPASATTPKDAISPERRDALRAAAQNLEASFLAEMLKHSGVAKPPSVSNGGAGEDAFASFLTDAYARELSSSGGLGLSESIFQSLMAREG